MDVSSEPASIDLDGMTEAEASTEADSVDTGMDPDFGYMTDAEFDALFD